MMQLIQRVLATATTYGIEVGLAVGIVR